MNVCSTAFKWTNLIAKMNFNTGPYAVQFFDGYSCCWIVLTLKTIINSKYTVLHIKRVMFFQQSFCQNIENQWKRDLANAKVWHHLTFCVHLIKSGDATPTPSPKRKQSVIPFQISIKYILLWYGFLYLF